MQIFDKKVVMISYETLIKKAVDTANRTPGNGHPRSLQIHENIKGFRGLSDSQK